MTTTAAPPRLALTRQEAARSLGVSLSHFQRHVQPKIGCSYSGRLRLFPVRELERYLECCAAQHREP